jgi:hypothetical protein
MWFSVVWIDGKKLIRVAWKASSSSFAQASCSRWLAQALL